MQAQQQTISSADAITLLVTAKGDAALAAAYAKSQLGIEISEPLLLAAIASDPNSASILARQMQLLMMLDTFHTLKLTRKMYLERLPQMSPDTVSKTYTKMLDIATQMLRSPAAQAPDQASQFEAIVKALPPEVADAVTALLQAPPPSPHNVSTMASLSADADLPQPVKQAA